MYVNVRMYVCTYVRMYVRMYVGMYVCMIPMNISSIKWQGSRYAIFCFMHLQRRSFRGSLTPLYSDFRVGAEICPDLFRFLQCSHDPGCSYLSTAIDHLIKDASGGGTTSEREPGPVPCEDMLREDGQTISLHSFILVPMPPNCHHKRLASTFQPTMKLVIEPASAILLHSLMPALAFQWAILE